MMTDAVRGNRKRSATREAQLLVVLAFIVAAWLQVGVELFLVAVAGITGNLYQFTSANAKVHLAGAEKAPNQQPEPKANP